MKSPCQLRRRGYLEATAQAGKPVHVQLALASTLSAASAVERRFSSPSCTRTMLVVVPRSNTRSE